MEQGWNFTQVNGLPYRALEAVMEVGLIYLRTAYWSLQVILD